MRIWQSRFRRPSPHHNVRSRYLGMGVRICAGAVLVSFSIFLCKRNSPELKRIDQLPEKVINPKKCT